jgi:hypothetical protein
MIAGLKRHSVTGESCPGSAGIEHRRSDDQLTMGP